MKRRKFKDGAKIVRPSDIGTVESDMGSWVHVIMPNGERAIWSVSDTVGVPVEVRE